VGIEMERLAASMGGTVKWPYNDSECLDADFFKVVADHLVTTSGIRSGKEGGRVEGSQQQIALGCSVVSVAL
jgi:hypothetical protein